MPLRKLEELSGGGSKHLTAKTVDNKATEEIPEMSASYAEMKPGEETLPHTHDRVEAYVFISGKAIVMCGDVITEVSTGDIAVSPIGVPHAIKVIGDEDLVFYALNSPPLTGLPMIEAPAEVIARWKASI